MVETNYKSYQQVINLSARTNTTSRSTSKVTKKLTQPIKRRTKSGCLTCRKRKKKCDEDLVDGKCQACTRNFLQCCWPQPATAVERESPVRFATTQYPTPDASPVAKATVMESDVSYVLLPPRAGSKTVSTPESSPRVKPTEELQHQFHVTTVDKNRMCDIAV